MSVVSLGFFATRVHSLCVLWVSFFCVCVLFFCFCCCCCCCSCYLLCKKERKEKGVQNWRGETQAAGQMGRHREPPNRFFLPLACSTCTNEGKTGRKRQTIFRPALPPSLPTKCLALLFFEFSLPAAASIFTYLLALSSSLFSFYILLIKQIN